MKKEVSKSRALRRKLLIALISCLFAVLGICTALFNMIYSQAVRNVSTHSAALADKTVQFVSDGNYQQFSAAMRSHLDSICTQLGYEIKTWDFHFSYESEFQNYFFNSAVGYFNTNVENSSFCDAVFMFDGNEFQFWDLKHSSEENDPIDHVFSVMEEDVTAPESGQSYADLNEYFRDNMRQLTTWYSQEDNGNIVVWNNMINYSYHDLCFGLIMYDVNAYTEPIRDAAREQTNELLGSMDALFTRYFYMMIGFLICVFMLFLAVSAIISKKLADPVVSEHDMLVQVNEMKTTFLSDASHELKTPLAAMSGYAQDAALDIKNGSEPTIVQDKLRRISSEANRMALMVTQILDATRIEEGRMVLEKAPCDLDSLVRETVQTYFGVLNKNNNRLMLRIPLELPKIEADSSRLQRVFVNLISNALKHTQNGTILIKAEQEDAFVKVTVRDSGCGISPEDLPHIWDRYYKGKHSETGTGLGLFICRFIVESHGGTISVESELKKGTAFTFTIPVSDA